ncbi:histidine triad nucleotide-binding protein [Rhizophagus clarus]|uniref:Histidine triad nucleotide-binding protein n=1 Tax=Rhizophagus clarus TaxID=94130 RepID=A0A8H3QV46_9GLOM|nr:histidine triad nucleotide-binding protein [Rhizophagus clarus]
MGFFSCFTKDVKDTTQDCVFCDLTDEKIVYKDERIVAFHDINPAAKIHLLIIPRNHIDSVNSLTLNDISLLKHMIDTGDRLLYEFGFQLPQRRNRFIGVKYMELMPWYSSGEKILKSLSLLNRSVS